MLLILAPICQGRARRKRMKERNEQALHELVLIHYDHPGIHTINRVISWEVYV